MKPKYSIRLIPRENDKPGIIASFAIEQELCVGPELADELIKALNPEGPYHPNPFSIDKVPISLDEISSAILRAVDIANSGIYIPSGSTLEVAVGQTQQDMSLLDFCHLDGRLRNCISYRIQGSAPPYELIFTSGLTRWSKRGDTQEQARKITKNLEELARSAEDPNSKNFIKNDKERLTTTEMIRSAVKCWTETWDAREQYEARMAADKENWRRHDQELKDRIREACGGGFRSGESGGFRGDGGFFK